MSKVVQEVEKIGAVVKNFIEKERDKAVFEKVLIDLMLRHGYDSFLVDAERLKQTSEYQLEVFHSAKGTILIDITENPASSKNSKISATDTASTHPSQ